MNQRLNDRGVLDGPVRQLLGASDYVLKSGLDSQLVNLAAMRASQINGCAFCLALHQKDLREAGEREDRLAVLPAWRETDWFTEPVRATLAWTEAVTTLERQHVPDEVFAQARDQFSEQELADLTMGVIVINGWNRLNVAFGNPPVAFDIEGSAVAAD